MKKVRVMLWLLALMTYVVGVVSVSAQARSVYWQRWDVTISDVQTTENRFRVTETYDISFSGAFSFGSAVIPLDYVEEIQNIEVYEEGEALRASCSNARGTFCATTTDNELSIVYYFYDPVNTERRSFSLEYTVIGALRVYEGGDQLWWDAIPADHFGFSIGSATIKVRMPQGYAPREGVDPVETYGTPSTVTVRGTNITATATTSLDGDDLFTIRVQYPHDPNARIASWQAAYDQAAAYVENVRPIIDIGVIAAALALAVALPLLIFTRYQRRGRDPQVGVVPTFLETPPSDMPPAMVGTLVDERADLRDVMSTIFDLGRRGYLVIEEAQTEGMFGIGKNSTFTFKRTDKATDNADLRKFEVRLLTSLFPGALMERTLDSLKTVFYTVISQMQSDLYTVLVAEGYFSNNPVTTRYTWIVIGIGLVGLGSLGVFAALTFVATISPALICLPMALIIGGIAAWIAAPAMPARTLKGAEESAKWKAFVEYLRNLDRYGDVGSAAQHFDQYLPYAVAAAIEKTWMTRFRQTQTYVPVPAWYFPTYLGPYSRGYRAGSPFPTQRAGDNVGLPGELARAGDGGINFDDVSGGLTSGLESISSGLTNMLDSAGRVMTSQPQPSSSSGRWSSGGRGFSGGGSFGGGGRGSGGGSRGFG